MEKKLELSGSSIMRAFCKNTTHNNPKSQVHWGHPDLRTRFNTICPLAWGWKCTSAHQDQDETRGVV